MADARLVTGLRLDQAQETKPRRIGDRLDRASQVLRVLTREGLLEQRRARRRHGRNRAHAKILTDVDVLVIIACGTASMTIDIRGGVGMSQALDPVTQHHIEQAADRLADEFAGVFSLETIARYMAESQDLLGEARINVFVPVLAHRFTRERLKALAQVEGKLVKEQPEVLFVCVHNAGRSQMAAGLVKLRSVGRVHVRSAGSAPGDEINPAVLQAMEDLGVDMSEEFPKPLTDEVVRAADVVITMGCGDACPIYPGKRYEDWELEDPEGKDLETVRRIRDDIDWRVQRLIGELIPDDTSAS
jgi:arsenate reductase